MKKIKTIIILLAVLTAAALPAEKFIITLSGNYLMPRDDNFKDTYGNKVFFPEIKFGYKFMKDCYVWGGLALFSKKGETPLLKEEAKNTQNMLSFGFGYDGKLSGKLGFQAEAGILYDKYKEEAMGVTVKDSAVGFRIDAALFYYLKKKIFLGAGVGYLSANDEIDIEGDTVSISLGGFKAGLCLGFKL